MKTTIFAIIIVILFAIYLYRLYKREVQRNNDRKARNAARDQAWLIEQENNQK